MSYSTAKASSSASASVLGAYIAFLSVAVLTYHVVAGGQMSSLMTLSALAQCLGVMFLCIQVLSTKLGLGISVKALTLDACSIAFRLSSTLWFNGYLPVDPTGDALYQLLEVASLLMIMWLMYTVKLTHHFDQESEDSANFVPIIVGCLLLASVFHGNLDDHPVFDTLWMTGLLIGAVAVLPQLSLIVKTGGRVQALTSHYIAALALSRALSGMFMWMARDHLSCDPWIMDIAHAKWAILGAHATQLLLVTDFAYHYLRSAIVHGVHQPLELPVASVGRTDDCGRARWI